MSATSSRIRRPAPSDLAAVVDLLNACDVAETGSPDTTLEDIENDWTLDGFDLSRDAWVAVRPEEQVVGYAYTGDQLRSGELEADVWVHPSVNEPGLTGRLLTLAQRRALELSRERGYAEARLDIFCNTTNGEKRELLRSRGFRVLRTVYRMAIDLTSPPIVSAPAGVDIRSFRLPDDVTIMHATLSEAFADGFWRSHEPFDAWRARLMGHSSFDPGLWLIAWEGSEAVGGVIAYDHGDLGWVKSLGVRRDWRRRGIGRALLAAALSALVARGQNHVELGVDAEGAAEPLRLYETAGMTISFAYEAYSLPLSAQSGSATP